MDSQLPLRILEAVGLLHRLGYYGLRVLPGINASGTAWRIVIFNVTEWNFEDEFGDPYNAEERCLYSTADQNVFNNDVQFPEDVSHVSVAEAILEAMPSLQRSTRQESGNQQYTSWYAMLMSQVHGLTDLPVAYADYFDESLGWELGWGSTRRVPQPPKHLPAPELSKRAGSDEHYVLELCDQVLAAKRTGQQTFPWLVGDPSITNGKVKPLPVDGYWADLGIVVEYHERQHTESVPFFDDKMTASGHRRGDQRRIYDARKAKLIPEHQLKLVIIDFKDFSNKRGKIVRKPAEDLKIVETILAAVMEDSAGNITR